MNCCGSTGTPGDSGGIFRGFLEKNKTFREDTRLSFVVRSEQICQEKGSRSGFPGVLRP
jgi:hypothetical protein